MTNATSDPEAVSLGSIVNQIAGVLRHGGGLLTTGDVAAIRRMQPERPAAAFFKLESVVLDPQLPGEPTARIDAETRWAAIVVGLAHLGALHQPGLRLGRALVAAELSEFRFARLIRADVERLVDELPMLARFLAAKNVSADWVGAAQLILSSGRKDEESARRELARDYYSAVAGKDRNHSVRESP